MSRSMRTPFFTSDFGGAGASFSCADETTGTSERTRAMRWRIDIRLLQVGDRRAEGTAVAPGVQARVARGEGSGILLQFLEQFVGRLRVDRPARARQNVGNVAEPRLPVRRV